MILGMTTHGTTIAGTGALVTMTHGTIHGGILIHGDGTVHGMVQAGAGHGDGDTIPGAGAAHGHGAAGMALEYGDTAPHGQEAAADSLLTMDATQHPTWRTDPTEVLSSIAEGTIPCSVAMPLEATTPSVECAATAVEQQHAAMPSVVAAVPLVAVLHAAAEASAVVAPSEAVHVAEAGDSPAVATVPGGNGNG